MAGKTTAYTKRGAAVEQLEAAALLLLTGGYEVAAHTLLGAVEQLLEDHATVSENRFLLEFKDARVRFVTQEGLAVKDVFNTERTARNFFKHANQGDHKDPDVIFTGVDVLKVNALLFVKCFFAIVHSGEGAPAVLLPALVYCVDKCENLSGVDSKMSGFDQYFELCKRLQQESGEGRRDAMLQEFERLMIA